MQFYTDADLSPRQALTPEGYLVARDTVIARCGRQVYHETELPDVTGDAAGWINVDRDADEVFDPVSIASLAGKPITDDHPDTEIGPDTWSQLALGFVSNPRRGTGANSDCVVADLVFTTRRGIDLVASASGR